MHRFATWLWGFLILILILISLECKCSREDEGFDIVKLHLLLTNVSSLENENKDMKRKEKVENLAPLVKVNTKELDL